MAKQKIPDPNALIVRNFGPIVTIALIFIGVGAVFYHIVEKWTWLDSVYFTVVTLATVGYGDFVPTTPLAKIFTIFYIVVGISIFIALARAVVVQVFLRREKKHKKRLLK